LNIRPATTDDLPRLRHLWQERRTILNQSDPRFQPIDQDQWQKTLQERIENPDAAVFVTLPNETIAGFISGILHHDIGVIDEIAIDAHTYHGGMARTLWAALRDWFETRDVKKHMISVPRYHAVEQAFWLALGAKTITNWEEDNLWELPPELIWMTL